MDLLVAYESVDDSETSSDEVQFIEEIFVGEDIEVVAGGVVHNEDGSDNDMDFEQEVVGDQEENASLMTPSELDKFTDEALEMIESGFGIYGDPDCKLELRPSLIHGAGMGVFVKDGCVFTDQDMITQFCGVRRDVDAPLTIGEQLRTVEVGVVRVVADRYPVAGYGLGAFINAAVNPPRGRFVPNCGIIEIRGELFVYAKCSAEYPLVGGTELYFSYGLAWWRLFHRLRNDGYTYEEILHMP